MPIISLTSIPPRFDRLGETLTSLCNQFADIDEIRVYVPKRYKRFPDWDGCLPDLPKGVRLMRVEEDFGPASKVLHAAAELKGTSTPILFCDDDRLYHPTWAGDLLAAHAEKPATCITAVGSHLSTMVDVPSLTLAGPRAKIGKKYFDPRYRWERTLQRVRNLFREPETQKPPRRLVAQAGYTETLLGYSGVLVLPVFFDQEFYEIPDDIWMVDDIWLSGHMERKGIGVWVPKRMVLAPRSGNDFIEALRETEFDGIARAGLNERAIRYFQTTYGIWGGHRG